MIRNIETVDEVINALGGNTRVAKALGTTSKAVSNWRKRGLPPQTADALRALLMAKGYQAPSSLWKMTEIVN